MVSGPLRGIKPTLTGHNPGKIEMSGNPGKLKERIYMRNQDPREIVARFNSVCHGTSRPIKKGDVCIYYPSSKKVYHIESAQAQSYKEWRQDLSFGYNY